MMVSTTDGSAKVEVSPILSVSPSAIFLRILRMIFPEDFHHLIIRLPDEGIKLSIELA